MKKSKKIVKKEQKSEKHNFSSAPFLKHISIQFDDFTQVYEDIDIGECINEESKYLSIKKLVKLMEKTYNISFLNKEIKYFLEDGQLWLACPKLKMNVGEVDYRPYQTIKLSAMTGKQYIDAIMDQSDSQSDSENNSDEQIEGDQKCRRLKERKIKHVIQKVLKWRQLYAGIGSDEKIPLEDGAKMVNISKKTLDDYLSQIKKGKKYGFNFNEHKNQKIGVLRQFIRKTEKNNKK